MSFEYELEDIRVGDRVRLKNVTNNRYLHGTGYGDVVRVHGDRILVELDATGRFVRVYPKLVRKLYINDEALDTEDTLSAAELRRH